MGSKVEYVESSHIYATNYVRNSKAIGVLWGIFTICYAIIVVVAFVTPEWIGDTLESEYPGRFGLWARCYFHSSSGGGEDCQGRLDDLSTVSSPAFRAATVFVGLSVILALLAICSMLLFFFFQSTTVFHVCGWIQVASAVCLVVGVVTYPAGWDSSDVKRTCGTSAGRYELGECGLRWACLLAVIGCLDAIILAALAFILATRHVRLQAEPGYTANGSLYKGEVNGGFVGDAQSVAGSRKSLNLHPVLLMPQPHHPGGEADRFSEFSNRTGRSKSSAYRAEYASSIQNFQL
ncbi:LHFPL tetraspan subfamily member 3 protein [Cryptotermes secundus]|uniref:LHFPL tetraspan subfamily member 3 protein n=1 Tax=Cryptotermes secundus TaxID=105785 RepID=UPI000CD7C13D|nr:LHFPL tetraspan subfamily member 3 protein [Cryptotermes secundus]